MSEKLSFTSQEVVEKLGVQPYIIALWEKQFGLQLKMGPSGNAYSPEDLIKLSSIKELLYEKGFSIDATKKFLQENPILLESSIIAASPLLFESKKTIQTTFFTKHIDKELIALRAQLLKLKELL